MKKLEIKLPSDYDGLSISVDNQLTGTIGTDYQAESFSFPLPDGDWRIYNEGARIITLMDYS